MTYTPIPVILDRMLSAGIKYEREQGMAAAVQSTAAARVREVRAGFLLIAQQRIRAQYKLVR